MIRAMIVVLLLALAACGAPGNPISTDPGALTQVRYTHDDEHGVGCWTFGGDGTYGKAISCLPDQDYQP